ncbi:MAG: Sir2 family NAD-dependent protein deacetylase [Pseudomonadota bacterium]
MTSSAPTDLIDAIGPLFAKADNIVFFTGAGISTESGIADFRSPGGIWSQIKPIQYQDFLDDEATRLEDWQRRFHFQAEFDAAPVNAGHRAVAAFMGQGAGLITQNIDGLHQRACCDRGIDDGGIVEIHGNGTRCACLSCQSPHTLDYARQQIEKTALSPRCTRCGGLLKASVISFGQPMPQDRVQRAAQMARNCDLFVVLGSSLVVQPAASLPAIARQAGAALVIINREETPLDSFASVTARVPIGDTMQAIARYCGMACDSWDSP